MRGFPGRFPVRDDGERPYRYRIVSLVSRGVLRTLFGSDLDVEAMARIPARGPLLVASNHLSNIDPFIFGGFAPRALFCMAKRELYGNPAIAWALAGCNCFPVDRGTPDRWALRLSLDLLSRGERLLLFIEGTRAAAPGMKRAEAGVGFLARRSGVPVLPVALWGTEQSLRRGRLLPRRVPAAMRVGDPFTPAATSGRGADQAVADEIGRHVAALLPPAYRGTYA